MRGNGAGVSLPFLFNRKLKWRYWVLKEKETHSLEKEIYVTPQEARKGRWKAIAAYLGVLVAIPVCFSGNSRFVKFHANQGFVLFLCELLLLIGTEALQTIVRMSLGSTIVLNVVSVTASVLEIAIGLWCIAGIVFVIKGRCVKLPLVGKICIFK